MNINSILYKLLIFFSNIITLQAQYAKHKKEENQSRKDIKFATSSLIKQRHINRTVRDPSVTAELTTIKKSAIQKGHPNISIESAIQ